MPNVSLDGNVASKKPFSLPVEVEMSRSDANLIRKHKATIDLMLIKDEKQISLACELTRTQFIQQYR